MYKVILMLILMVIFNGCEEVYSPDVENSSKVLVVEGLLTDEIKNPVVYLSNSVKFNSNVKTPETGALVYITDEKGQSFYFIETAKGTYELSTLQFTPQVGSKYILTIKTADSNIYKSTEQELLPKGDSSSLNNFHREIDFYKYVGGEFKLSSMHGSQFITSLNLQNETNPYFRYQNTVLTEYSELPPPPDSTWKYCWEKYNPNEHFSINNILYNNSGFYQHDLGFFPLDTTFYEVVIITHIERSVTTYTRRFLYNYFVSIKQYHINKDVHDIYKSINKQLEAEQHIFDPITSQITGNIHCITDSSAKVFGLFEVASVNLITLKMNYSSTPDFYSTQPIKPVDPDIFPICGCDTSKPPPFWIY